MSERGYGGPFLALREAALTMTLTEFLLARIAEDEARAHRWQEEWRKDGGVIDLTITPGPARVLAKCEADRRIVELHESWPVMVETTPKLDRTGSDADSMTFRMSQQIAWLTTQEYRARFGDEPPTTPVLRALALPYADHPDYREEWAL